MSKLLATAVRHCVTELAIPSISYALFDTQGILASEHVTLDGTTLPDDALLRIGSISKCFTAIAAMGEVAAGHLDLDADISRYLGDFSLEWEGRGVSLTLGRLLNHRSGLTREPGRGHYLADDDAPLSATVDSLRRARIKVSPGIYRYSNAGFALAGACVESVTGVTYADALTRAILGPLQLGGTRLGIGEPDRQRLAPARMWSASSSDRAAPTFNLGSAPAGGIVATIGDLATFGRALLGTGLLPQGTLGTMWQVPEGVVTGYAMGFMVGELAGQRTVGHGGVVYGYASELRLLPDAGLGIVMVATLDAVNDSIIRLCRYGLQLALSERGIADMPPTPSEEYGGPCAIRQRVLRDGPIASAAVSEPDGDYDEHAGDYGPSFLPTRLIADGDRLRCVMEEFFAHGCLPLGDGRFRLGPGMYEDEVLEVALQSPAGRPAIRVGEMVFERRN